MIHTPCPTLHREIGRYLDFLDEVRKEMPVVEITTYEACVARAEAIRTSSPETPGPGRYEGNDDRQLAEMLDVLSSDQSYLDEQAGDVQAAGWIGRVGRFIVTEDDHGFFTYHDDENEVNAEAHFALVEGDYEAAVTETDYNV